MYTCNIYIYIWICKIRRGNNVVFVFLVFLLFVEAQAEIAGASEKYLMLNSPLHLECVVRQSPVDPVYIFWYHDSRMINYDIDRGVNVTSDLPNKHSALYIERASRSHSGNYTCAPSNAFAANTVIHILNGKCLHTRAHPNTRRLYFIVETIHQACI